MEATLRQAQQPGYACITVSNCPSVTEVRCSIQRSSDGQYLSKEGLWGNTIESIIPENPFWDNEVLTFFLPLYIVSDMDSLDGYALYLNDLDRCILDIPEEINVTDTSSTGCLGGVPEVQAPTQTAGYMPEAQPVPQQPYMPEQQPVPQPQYMPEQQPAPQPQYMPEQQPVPEQQYMPEQQPVPQPEANPEAWPPQDQNAGLSFSDQPGEGKKGPKLAIIVAIAIALLLACGAGLYFSGVLDDIIGNQNPVETPAENQEDNAKDTPEEGTQPENPDAGKEEPAAPADEPPAAEEPPAPDQPAAEPPAASPEAAAPEEAAPAKPLSSARTLLQSGAGSAALLDKAKAMLSPGASEESADAAFLLVEQAAQNGDNAEAMFMLGQFYDPSAAITRGTIQPDLMQAHDWYKKAAGQGQGEASAALNSLRQTVESKASTGDREAQSLLRNW